MSDTEDPIPTLFPRTSRISRERLDLPPRPSTSKVEHKSQDQLFVLSQISARLSAIEHKLDTLTTMMVQIKTVIPQIRSHSTSKPMHTVNLEDRFSMP